jgi:hypothetical protein
MFTGDECIAFGIPLVHQKVEYDISYQGSFLSARILCKFAFVSKNSTMLSIDVETEYTEKQ